MKTVDIYIYGYQKHGNTMRNLVETVDGSIRILQSEYIIVQIITRNILGGPHPYLSA